MQQPGLCLRILVEGGGCAGFQYKFEVLPVDKAVGLTDSLVFESDGVKVVSDVVTLEMINGSSIEYREEMIRSSFEVVGNPQAESGCSCGTSFTPKNL